MNVERNEPKRGRVFWIWVGVVALGILVAGSGFVFKLTEFIKVAQNKEAESFAIVPVVTYFLVTGGFICLFIWNYLRGGFDNIFLVYKQSAYHYGDYDGQMDHQILAKVTYSFDF